MDYIYKICDQALWDAACRDGRFTGAEIDVEDGFIHFSTGAQLAETLALHFVGRENLLVLQTDPSGLDITWEPARSGDLFPHLYGDLPITAVVSVFPIDLGPDGRHRLPTQL